MLQEIDYLRQIAVRCRDGRTLDPELANWLGTCLDAFLTHRVRHVDDAFGLRPTRGGVAWWREDALRKRDAALRALAKQFFDDPSYSARAQAQAIWILSRRYAASTWRFDKKLHGMPTNYARTPKEYLWTAFQSGAPMPIGERQLRAILGGRNLSSALESNLSGQNKN